MRKERRNYRIVDVDCVVTVWAETRKNLLGLLDDYLDNFNYEWFDGSDQCFAILYKDGSFDMVDNTYDGHKVKRQNIASIVYDNAEDTQVFGNFEINGYGVVSPAFEYKNYDVENIVEIA